ncbi:MAG: PAS domain-containing sensor histidine kinase [Alphaproteobacteria bacterium]
MSSQPREIRSSPPTAPIGRGADALGGLLGPLAGGPPAILADRRGCLSACNEAYARLAASFEPALPAIVGAAIPVPGSVLERVVPGGPRVEYEWNAGDDRDARCLHFELWSPVAAAEITVLGLVRERGEAAVATRRLREAEARFEDIARLTSDWVWEIDESFHFTYASPRISEMIGVPARFMLGQHVAACGRFEGFPEANYAGDPDRHSMAPFRDVAYEMTASDGQRRLFRMSGVPVFDSGTGRFLGFRGIAHDISAQAVAEARALAAQTRLVHAIESIPQGFALYDASDRLLLCNSSYEELITGRSDQTLGLGTPYERILEGAAAARRFPGDAEAVSAFIEVCKTYHRDTVEGHEFSLCNGRWVLMSVDRTDDGGTVEVWNDITEIRRREAAIRAAEEEARQALDLAEAGNRAKSEFLAAMSHELRTPLNAIIGFSEIIRDQMYGPVGHASYADYAADIHASGKHLLDIISDILEFAKIEAGKLKLNERTINLRAALQACLRVIEPRAREAEVTVEDCLAKDLPRVKADETRLKQIAINLLSNAVKYTPPGGKVTLSASVDPKAGCCIAVRDTGIGIAPDDIPRALSAFGQLESHLSRRFEGTGLGLTLAKSLTEMHGGTLAIESEVNVGTVVTVTLPAERILPH